MINGSPRCVLNFNWQHSISSICQLVRSFAGASMNCSVVRPDHHRKLLRPLSFRLLQSCTQATQYCLISRLCLTIRLRMLNRSKTHLNSLFSTKLLGKLSRKRATIIRYKSLRHPKSTYDFLPIEGFNPLCCNRRQSLSFHPLCEIIYRHYDVLQLTPRHWKWAQQIHTPNCKRPW